MLIDLASEPPATRVGAKAARLGWLIRRGWTVPAGVVAPFEVTEQALRSSGDGAWSALRDALAEQTIAGRRYVVRSSANVEDSGSRSFAGQFLSVCDVTGEDDIAAAIRDVVESGRSDRVVSYARRVGVDPGRVRVAAIVQEQVPSAAAGVAFSCDPVSGVDRVVIEAVAGPGELLVGQGSDAQRWAASGAGLVERPASPALVDDVVVGIADAVRAIAAASGEPADVEWVWDGEHLHLVQWRPISGLRSPRIWSARLARDMLPGMIPPLVWSVNVPVLSRVWSDLVTEALGDVGLDPDDLVRAFGYRAYFNTTAFGAVFESLGMPADALERMRAGTDRSSLRPPATSLLRRSPRLARFAWRIATWDRHVGAEQTAIDGARHALEAVDPAALSDDALVARTADLKALLARAARLNVVTPLLADHTAALVRRAADACGIDAGRVEPGQELAQVQARDPAHALAGIDFGDEEAWQRFLARFGHLSDSPNDCSRPTWSEQPEVIRQLALPGADAGQRERVPPATKEEVLAALPSRRRVAVGRRWDRAARYRLAREQVGYGYARVYALFRPTLLEAGRRLVARGAIGAEDDVFLLTWGEVRAALDGGGQDWAATVLARRAEMTEAADVVFPETIVGDDPVPVRGRSTARVLTGVPTSGGRLTGPVRVVTSLSDAGAIGSDDVLVLAAADVTWTPLLLRAGAVITETGGMLAHASIVARELGIPCVASVEGATRIPEGALVSVDGAAGEVLILAPPPDAGSTTEGVR